MEILKRILCTLIGASVGGLTGVLIGLMAGATDLSTLHIAIQKLEIANDRIRAEDARKKAHHE